MKKGYLSGYFSGIAAKRLSAVEADPEKSHQHEFNGVVELKKILGEQKITFTSKFVRLNDDEDSSIQVSGDLTWYDARDKHPSRTEYRLYYKANSVTDQLKEGDLVIFAQRAEGDFMFISAPLGSTVENQLLWLFGIAPENLGEKFETKEVKASDKKLNFASRFILDELEIESVDLFSDDPDGVIERFGDQFPKTFEFSLFARQKAGITSAADAPDEALLIWLNKEEELFRRLERHIVSQKLKDSFGDDVDAFVELAKSVLNRRKSRVGFSLENHLSQIFNDNGITYSNGKITENKARPDFLFPSVEQYHEKAFPIERLTMLGAKTTCKDRWRQVLSEAQKIPKKHLLTLEPGISTNQTNEMQAHHLQLVLPSELHETYSPEQRKYLMNLNSFIDLVKKRQ